MAKKLLRFSLWLTVSFCVLIIAFLFLGTLLSASATRVVLASDGISLPKFPYEVVRQIENTEYKLKWMYVIIPKELCSEANVRSIFQWHSKESSQWDYLYIEVFTSRENADWAYAHRPEIGGCTLRWPGFWEYHFPWMYPPKWDASYWRITREWSKAIDKAEERYEFKPFTILPFWKKEVILKQSSDAIQ